MACDCDNCQCSGSENIVQYIGQRGEKGEDGAVPTIVQGIVTELNPGDTPTVELESIGDNIYAFNFGIPPGANGTNGTSGTNGWSPILAVITDGERRVLKIVDWTGGSGTEPSTTDQFIGATGIVATAALAVNIRGAAGSDASSAPIGSSMEWNGTSDPAGGLYLIEDGRAISRATYATLFGIIGTTYGVGNGSTTFNIPNSQGKFTAGKDGSTEFGTLGGTGGAKTKTLSAQNLPLSSPWNISDPSHGHTTLNGTNVVRAGGGAGSGIPAGSGIQLSTITASASTTGITLTTNTGGAQSFSILPPYIVKNKIIRVL